MFAVCCMLHVEHLDCACVSPHLASCMMLWCMMRDAQYVQYSTVLYASQTGKGVDEEQNIEHAAILNMMSCGNRGFHSSHFNRQI
jgi:hypothetical protein